MILVAGDLLLDVFMTPGLLQAEQASGLHVRGGGSAANTSAWIAALGHQVRFVACGGDDHLRGMLGAELEEGGVETRIRTVEGTETGCVVIRIEETAERVMQSSRGANLSLSPADIRAGADGPLEIVHLTGYALLGPFGLSMLEAASETAAATGALLSFDPSSRTVIETLGVEMLLKAIEEARVDILLPNCEEACVLTGENDPERAAAILCAGRRLVVVKDGGRGAGYAAGASDGRSTSRGYVPAQAVWALDTTGAGDAFDAGVLVAVARGEDADAACALGHRVAEQVVTQVGGRPPRDLGVDVLRR